MGLLHLRRLAIRSMRTMALLSAVIICSAAAQDSVTGNPPPCVADIVVAHQQPADWSAGDSVDTEESEAPPFFELGYHLSQPSFSLAASPTPLSLRVDIPPELAL